LAHSPNRELASFRPFNHSTQLLPNGKKELRGRKVDVQTVPRMDNENYVERLGDLCRALAEHLTNPCGTAAGSS
jgi:hypothetical protein